MTVPDVPEGKIPFKSAPQWVKKLKKEPGGISEYTAKLC